MTREDWRLLGGIFLFIVLLAFIGSLALVVLGLGVWFLIATCVTAGTAWPLLNLLWMIPVAVALYIGFWFLGYWAFRLSMLVGWPA